MRSSAETPLEPAMAEAVLPSVVRSTMPNHLVVDSLEDATAASHPTSVPAYMYLARRVSTLLAPAPVSGLLVLFVALYHTHTLLIAFAYAAVTFFFIGLGPLVFVLLGVHSGKLSDIDLSHRTERTWPFLFGLASAMLGLFVLLYLHGPKALETVLICTAVGGVVLMVTTWWWKISVHAATMAGAVTMLTALYGPAMLPALFLLVLVCWSRVVLRRHTVVQVVVGSLVSIVLTLAVILLRGI